MKKINNKGYMLVEIILAFVIAIGVVYFMFELIIKLKNKNDDLIVKTLVATDQTIIYNTIMEDLTTSNSFDCSKIEIIDSKFKYDGKFISEMSEYANVKYEADNSDYCSIGNDYLTINIPINVKQLSDNFDVNIKIRSEFLENSPILCSLELTEDNKVQLSKDIDYYSNIIYQGFNSNYEGEISKSKNISSVGTYTYYVKAKNGVTGQCSIKVVNTNVDLNCDNGLGMDNNNKCYELVNVKLNSNKCICYFNGSGHLQTVTNENGCVVACNNLYGEGYEYIPSYYSCSNGELYNYKYCKIIVGSATKKYSCPSGYVNKVNDYFCWNSILE